MKKKIKFRDVADGFLLELLLNATNDAIVVIDKEGYIEEISDAYVKFLRGNKADMIGKHVAEVIENTRMHEVLITGRPEIASLQQIHGHSMIASRFPIIKDGEVIGALGKVVFKDIKELTGLYAEMNMMEQELHVYKKKFGKINVAKYTGDDLIGESDVMRELKETISRVANGNSGILISGESGTGKELFAHAVHAASNRRDKPLISVNCASIPSELMESEFFGYEEGSFTGAKKGGKIGLIKAADGGTLFLDEIGDLPMHMQVKLLRVLQEKEVRKVGSTVGEPFDARIIAATNRNLHELMDEGKFRSDLFYRLNVVGIVIPPLRDRKEDIQMLSEALLNKIAARHGIMEPEISGGAMEALRQYDWPGNIRELENVLERAVNFLDSDRVVKVKQLDMELRNESDENISGPLKTIVEFAEKNAILAILHRHGGSKTKASKELGISRTSLYEKLEKHDIGGSGDN